MFENFGINEFIILDLSRVGSKLGGISPIVLDVLNISDSKIITGGGIRTINEIYNLRNTKLDGILIATALHNGTITPADIKNYYNNLK